MALCFTLGKAPISPDLKDSCGLPWSCVLQPFSPNLPVVQDRVAADEVARCVNCYAYICRQCSFQRTGWICALCDTLNEFHSLQNQRYLSQLDRSSFAELRSDTVEADCPLVPLAHHHEAADGAGEEGGHSGPMWEVEAQPLYLALVDTSCDPDFLELTRSALLAALEALPSSALFGLVSVADQIGLHEALDTGPVVRYVPILPDGPDPTTVPLQEALPLRSLLACVGTQRDAIVAMLEALQPAASALVPGGDGSRGQAHVRAVGAAVQAVLRFLGSAAAESRAAAVQGSAEASGGRAPAVGLESHAAYTGARLLVFLSGPPTHGRGSVVAPAPAPSAEPAAPRQPPSTLEPLLLDPVFPELTAWTPTEAEGGGEDSWEEGGGSGAGEVWIDLQHVAGGEGDRQLVVNWGAAAFYEEAGVAAAALGVSADIFAACPQFVGLELLRPLAAKSGGTIRLYTSLEEAPLPQDVYKRLCAPHAFSCLLRLRTSSLLRVTPRCFSASARPDPDYDNLYHLPACAPGDTLALDLRHVRQEGLRRGEAEGPLHVQLAFQYSTLEPALGGGGEAGEGHQGGAKARRYVLRRRLRITTVSFGVASTPLQLLTSCDAPATAFVLMHKVLGAAAAEGRLHPARALLREWLAALVASCAAVLEGEGEGRREAAGRRRKGRGRRGGGDLGQQDGEAGGEEEEEKLLDASFASLEALQPLPRLIYGLLCSPLLRPLTPGRHPDEASALGALWCSLPPPDLATAAYPQLSSWASPNDLAFPRHSLSRAAVEASGQPLFLLDAYSLLVVCCVRGAQQEGGRGGAGVQFPPPQGSELRMAVNVLRQGRAVMPRLRMVQEGVGDMELFWGWMIEDGVGADVPDLPPFLEFLQGVEQEAAGMLVDS